MALVNDLMTKDNVKERGEAGKIPYAVAVHDTNCGLYLSCNLEASYGARATVIQP